MEKIKGLTFKIVGFGSFAVICQLCGILLFYNIRIFEAPPGYLARICLQMLEYSLISTVAVLVGGLLMYLVGREARE